MDHLKETELSTVEVDNSPQGEAPQVEDFDKSAPDRFDEKYRTTRNEIWAYYACVGSIIELDASSKALNTRIL